MRVRSELSPYSNRPEGSLRLANSRRVSRRGGLQYVQHTGLHDEVFFCVWPWALDHRSFTLKSPFAANHVLFNVCCVTGVRAMCQ